MKRAGNRASVSVSASLEHRGGAESASKAVRASRVSWTKWYALTWLGTALLAAYIYLQNERYLTNHIRYALGSEELAGLSEYFLRCHRAGLIEKFPELHFYDGVPHGFGLRSSNTGPVKEWPQRFVEWLRARQIL